jgi:hypothetical protein
MSNIPRYRRAIIIGPSGKQADLLRRRVGNGTLLRILTPERSLRFQGDESDVVILMRCVGHKHEMHLRRVANCPVVFIRFGGVEAVVRALNASPDVNVIAAKETA